jgi:hypothetical protein
MTTHKIYSFSSAHNTTEVLCHFEETINTGDWLPISNGEKKKHITERTKNIIGRLIDLVFALNPEDLSKVNCNRESTLKKLWNLSAYIELCIDAFLVGDVEKCYDSINRLVFEYLAPRTMFIQPKQSFYRMRVESECSRKILTGGEMFHIPFDKIERVKNQRYSISGYPVLYLGSNLRLCWIELGAPYSQCFVSHFSNTKPLKLLDMTFPEQVKDENDILWLALILATSIPKKTDNASFTPEYIIPQGILHSLIRRRREADGDIDGVVYTSSKYYTHKETFSKYRDSFNYAFPTINKNYHYTGHCENLLAVFETTNGIPFVVDHILFEEMEEKLTNIHPSSRLSGIYKPVPKDWNLLDKNPFI